MPRQGGRRQQPVRAGRPDRAAGGLNASASDSGLRLPLSDPEDSESDTRAPGPLGPGRHRLKTRCGRHTASQSGPWPPPQAARDAVIICLTCVVQIMCRAAPKNVIVPIICVLARSPDMAPSLPAATRREALQLRSFFRRAWQCAHITNIQLKGLGFFSQRLGIRAPALIMSRRSRERERETRIMARRLG